MERAGTKEGTAKESRKAGKGSCSSSLAGQFFAAADHKLFEVILWGVKFNEVAVFPQLRGAPADGT